MKFSYGHVKGSGKVDLGRGVTAKTSAAGSKVCAVDWAHQRGPRGKDEIVGVKFSSGKKSHRKQLCGKTKKVAKLVASELPGS